MPNELHRGPPMIFHYSGRLLFCVLFVTYVYVHQRGGWNQNSRLDLLHSLVLHHTFAIDTYHENTGDKSYHEGHYYSDKAPGVAFLALPAFVVSVSLLKLAGISPVSSEGWLISSWLTTAGSVAFIAAMGGVAVFSLLRKFLNEGFAFIAVLISFIGSLPFTYSTMLFSHGAVIGLISISLWAAYNFNDVSLSKSRDFLTGFCCGLAIACEFTAAVASGGVLAFVASQSLRRALIVIAASIFPLLLIPLYNVQCFGAPLSFGYHHLALEEFQDMNKGLFGITFPPNLDAAYLVLLSPERGLLFWTPFFLIAFLSTRVLLSKIPRLFWISWVAVGLHIICISGYYMPSGGSALGPRHLAPIIPFLTLFAAGGLQARPFVGCVLGFYSLVFTILGTVVEGMPPEEIKNPLVNFYVAKLLRGDLTHNLGMVLGLPPTLSLLPLVLVVFGSYFALFTIQWRDWRCTSEKRETSDVGQRDQRR